MRVEKKNKEHVKEAGLGLLRLHYQELAVIAMATTGAIRPRESALFEKMHNALVEETMQEVRAVLQQYERNRPNGPLGPERRRP